MSSKNKRNGTKHKPQKQSNSPLFFVAGGVVLVAIAAVLLLSSGGSPQSSSAPEVTGAPSLKADGERVDLGDVSLGQTVSASFLLTNVGDQPLFFTEPPYVEVVEGC